MRASLLVGAIGLKHLSERLCGSVVDATEERCLDTLRCGTALARERRGHESARSVAERCHADIHGAATERIEAAQGDWQSIRLRRESAQAAIDKMGKRG